MRVMEKLFGAIVVAAGNSTRMGGGENKVLRKLAGVPVIKLSVDAITSCPLVGEIAVVCKPGEEEFVRAAVGEREVPVSFVPGGELRQDSVRAGEAALSENWRYILIHDGARPLVSGETVLAVCEDALKYGASTAAVKSKDTCKLGYEFVESTVQRERLYNIQTPQGFSRELYREALEKAEAEGKSYTDDCQLIESIGGRVKLTAGTYGNIKLTTPEDFLMAGALLIEKENRRGKMRVGEGYDVHRLVEGRKLILGGVEISFEKGLLGHSDADVLLHAVADALLGAAALGDIGHLFPDTDPKFEGADSLELLSQVVLRVRDAGYRIENIDATVIAQRPKIAPYIQRMRENISRACDTNFENISVKATTEEGLGFTGRGEGIAARAVALLEREG